MFNLLDKEVQSIIDLEYGRQQNELEMIASENYVSKEVMQSYSNVFTNKYSEWYIWKRYYWGQEYVDKIEWLAVERALKIFNLSKECRWVNVQPLSWWPANAAVYLWLLKPWAKILWMDLSSWWHLSHWHKLNISWLYYNIISYWVDKNTFLIDYDDILEKALKEKPDLILAWFSAYSRQIDWSMFSDIADKVYDKHWYRPILMADIAHVAWLIAWNVYSWPFEYFDIVTSTTHKTLRWPRWWLIYYKLDYKNEINRWLFPWLQWWPHEHIIAAKAVAFWEILNWDFESYAKKVVANAKLISDALIEKWWNIITWWTDNHIILLDVTVRNGENTNIWWKIAEIVLEKVWISTNKNMLPFDDRSPMDPSWIRLGTPAITTRWLWKTEMLELARIIDTALVNNSNDNILNELREQVKIICNKFPLSY